MTEEHEYDSRYDEDEDEYYEAEWHEDGGEESDKQKQFKKDMEEAGYRVEFYRGRYFCNGWAVRAEGLNGLQAAIRATEINCQWDTLGKDGYIVYPQT